MPQLTSPSKTGSTSDVLARLCNLPRINPSANRLLGVSNEVDNALEEFAQIFGADPSLAVELLRAANAAQFELQARVTNLQFALMVLGIEGTRNLAFTITMRSYAGKSPYKLQIKPIWLHSIATAVIAEEIGHCTTEELGDLYTAGLTHDIGRLGLLQADGARYAESLIKTFASMTEADALEKVLLGVTHAEAGAYLAQTWGFPPSLCRSISSHHTCLTEEDGRSERINQLACVMAGELGYPELPNCPVPARDPLFAEQFRNRVELAPERLKALVQRRIQAV